MRPTAIRLVKIRLLSKADVDVQTLQLPPSRLITNQRKQEETNTVASKLAEQMSATSTGTSVWPTNLRIEKAEKKTMFWKVCCQLLTIIRVCVTLTSSSSLQVPRDRRTELKRLLRES